MTEITFETVFLTILGAMVGQNRVIAPTAQGAVATNALDMAGRVMRAYEIYESQQEIQADPWVPEPRQESLSEALGIDMAEVPGIDLGDATPDPEADVESAEMPAMTNPEEIADAIDDTVEEGGLGL